MAHLISQLKAEFLLVEFTSVELTLHSTTQRFPKSERFGQAIFITIDQTWVMKSLQMENLKSLLAPRVQFQTQEVLAVLTKVQGSIAVLMEQQTVTVVLMMALVNVS